MKFFAKAPPWVIFVILLSPFICGIVVYLILVLNDWSPSTKSVLSAIIIGSIGVLLAWIYSVTTVLNKGLPEKIRLNLTLFQIAIGITFILAVVWFIVPSQIIAREVGGTGLNSGFLRTFNRLLGMVLFYYPIYIMDKVMNLAESNTVSGIPWETLFSIFFWPFGVWRVQNRINLIYFEMYEVEKYVSQNHS